ERLSPDNPLMLTPDGTLAGWNKDTRKSDYFALELYKSSMRPTMKRGPKKKDKPKHETSQGRLDPLEAERAYHMDEQGTHWKVIARELLPELNLNDRRKAEQARKRIDRLIERGSLIQSKYRK